MDKKLIIKQRLLEEIAQLKKENITIVDADYRLFQYLLKLADDDIQKAYEELISELVPF
jgi:hypothetical protein